MNDIFDLGNTDDIPKDIADELVINTRDQFEININELFQLAKQMGVHNLNIDQITVAYYRQYVRGNFGAENKTRRQIAVKISNMIRGIKPLIASVPDKKGVYRLKN